MLVLLVFLCKKGHNKYHRLLYMGITVGGVTAAYVYVIIYHYTAISISSSLLFYPWRHCAVYNIVLYWTMLWGGFVLPSPAPALDVLWAWWRHQMDTCSRYWPFMRGPVNSLHTGQWRGGLTFSFIYISGWVNNHKAGDLRRHCAYYDVIVMETADFFH